MLTRRWSNGHSHSLLVGMKTGTATLEDTLAVYYKLLPYDRAIVLLGVYPNELETYVYAETCTQMFIAVLFIFANIWEQPRCPSAGKWIYCDTSRQWNIIQH